MMSTSLRHEMEMSGFLGDSVVLFVVVVFFLETVLREDVFVDTDIWENVLLRTDTWYFSGGCLEKGHVC